MAYIVSEEDMHKMYPNLQMGPAEGDGQSYVVHEDRAIAVHDPNIVSVDASSQPQTVGGVQQVLILEEGYESLIPPGQDLILQDGRFFVTVNKEPNTPQQPQQVSQQNVMEVIQNQRSSQKQMIRSLQQQQPSQTKQVVAQANQIQQQFQRPQGVRQEQLVRPQPPVIMQVQVPRLQQMQPQRLQLQQTHNPVQRAQERFMQQLAQQNQQQQILQQRQNQRPQQMQQIQRPQQKGPQQAQRPLQPGQHVVQQQQQQQSPVLRPTQQVEERRLEQQTSSQQRQQAVQLSPASVVKTTQPVSVRNETTQTISVPQIIQHHQRMLQNQEQSSQSSESGQQRSLSQTAVIREGGAASPGQFQPRGSPATPQRNPTPTPPRSSMPLTKGVKKLESPMRPLLRLQWPRPALIRSASPQRAPAPLTADDELIQEQVNKIKAECAAEMLSSQQRMASPSPKNPPVRWKSQTKAPGNVSVRPTTPPVKGHSKTIPLIPPRGQQLLVLLPGGQQVVVPGDSLQSPLSFTQLLQQAGVEGADNAHVDMQSFLAGGIATPAEIVSSSPTSTQLASKSPQGIQTRHVVVPVLTTSQLRTSASNTSQVQARINAVQSDTNSNKEQQVVQQSFALAQKVQLPQHLGSSELNAKLIHPMTLPITQEAAKIPVFKRNQQKGLRPGNPPATSEIVAVVTQKEQEVERGVKNQSSGIEQVDGCRLLPGQQAQPLKEEPPMRPRPVPAGHVAVCPFCGLSNVDLNKCYRCKRKLPESVKIRPIVVADKEGSKKDDVQGRLNEPTLNQSVTVAPKPVEGEKAAVYDIVPESEKKTTQKKKKKPEEPVILVLSSDEEDGGGSGKAQSSNSLTPSSQPYASKEPVYTAAEMAPVGPEPDATMPDEPDGSYTMMVVKHCRVGNFKSEHRDRFIVSSAGVQFTVLSAIDGDPVSVFIKKSSLKAVLVNCGQDEPMILLYPTRAAAVRIRSMLGVTNEAFFYYDPCSPAQAFRRLILFVEKMTEENKTVMSSVLEELLLEISDAEREVIMAKVMVAPPPVATTRVILNFEKLELTNTDYACLAEETYINDVIIDFYLTYLSQRVLSSADRARTHIFSSFFYNRLTKKLDRRECSKDSPAEKRHKRVRRWTKKTNLFEKDFIIIPINENSHWFLAMICFPNLTGPVRFSDNTPLPEETAEDTKTGRTSLPAPVQVGNTAINKTENGPVALLPDSDRDEAEAEDDLSDEESEVEQQQIFSNGSSTSANIPLIETQERPSSPKKRPLPSSQQPIKQPCILIFDSLRGSNSRARVVATLRDFLKIEYKWKTGQDREFTKDNFKGAVLKVPQQDNYYDCGLFVLQYVESFFEKPLTDYRLPIRYLNEWFSEEQTRNKRQEVANLIQSLMQQQGVDPRAMNLPDLQNTTAYTAEAYMEEEDEEGQEEDEMDEEEQEVYEAHMAHLRATGRLVDYDDDDELEDDSEDYHEVGVEEGELQVHSYSDMEEDAEVKAPPKASTSASNAEATTPLAIWTTSNLGMVQKILPNHAPADGVTRQYLKSVRIQRGNILTKTEQPQAKRAKSQ